VARLETSLYRFCNNDLRIVNTDFHIISLQIGLALLLQARSFHAVKTSPRIAPEVKTGHNQSTDFLGSRDKATPGLLGQPSVQEVMKRADDAEGFSPRMQAVILPKVT
jgi:hypothetical protein